MHHAAEAPFGRDHLHQRLDPALRRHGQSMTPAATHGNAAGKAKRINIVMDESLS